MSPLLRRWRRPTLLAQVSHTVSSQQNNVSPLFAQVAAAYLAWCPVHGRAALESLLSTLPLHASDPTLAAKAVAVCRRHGLDHLAEGGSCRGLGHAGRMVQRVWRVPCSSV